MSEPTERLNAALRGAYLLERPIGQGGMATVYLAQDLKHQRRVAFKMLKPELAQNLGPERFRREITTAARLQHPHILTVLDSGEAAGLLWFTMPYVNGETLRDRLRRERCLPVDEALRITREAAQALQHAHEDGIVHRDIKPENLLLTKDGSTLVADFGIARALESEGLGTNTTGENLTQTGTSLGTPTYMAPEQATGEKQIDARVDQYALAVTLYEMLAGEPPFTGPTGAALIAKRFTTPTPSVRERRPEVSPLVDQALQQALSLRAADRFATMREFFRVVTQTMATPSSASAVALPTVPSPAVSPTVPVRRRLSPVLVGVGLLVLVGAGALLLRRSPTAPSPVAAAPAAGSAMRLAVLPFENLGDSADAYFADGISDELRGKLTALAGLEVIARTSSVPYRGTAKPPQEIARELGVRYLLTGTVRWEKSGGGKGRVRVSPELIEVSPNGAPASKWQQAFDAPLTDVFQVQSGIAEQVARALNVALGNSEAQVLAERPTRDLEAYDAFLRAEALSFGDIPEEQRRAEALFERAVRRDSTFAKAWAGLARLRTGMFAGIAWSPELADKARRALDRAMALAPDDPSVVLARAEYERSIARDSKAARRLLEQALERTPNNADLLYALSGVMRGDGDLPAAIARIEEARRLDPRNVRVNIRYAWTLLWLRDLPAARAAARRADSLQPLLTNVQTRVMVELAAGDLPAARALVRDALGRSDPAEVTAYFALFNDLFWALEPADLRRIFQATDDGLYGGGWARLLTWAQVYRHLGDTATSRRYADSTRVALVPVLRRNPRDVQATIGEGIALAYLGRRDEAVAAGKRAVQLSEEQDPYDQQCYAEHQLARVHAELGEPDAALDILERLLAHPYYVTRAWLRIDPTFAALRGHPRFETLVTGN